MTEVNNGGNLQQYLKSFNCDFTKQVSQSYREFVFDIVIQIATGLEAAHKNGLIHGSLDLSKVLIHFTGKQNCIEIKLTDF